VKDFQIHLTVKEERPIVALKVDVPIIGQISGENIEVNDREVKIVFNMSEVEQVLSLPFPSCCF
jgi:hypothetical protein